MVYALRVTGKLYARMVEAAFGRVDEPRSYGESAEEKRFAKV